MLICIEIISGLNYFLFISIRSCTKNGNVVNFDYEKKTKISSHGNTEFLI